ncbi:D-arabinono-1,4-lactone oxidase [Embleya sp. NPDC050493]|uniref:D-arabinono-1,4-lactone oxidase n=1 Tax=Embleya sp. NPDC050493 TaxID=3363989 RepID=UPI0037A9EC55
MRRTRRGGIGHGRRLNLAKESRAAPETIHRMYPRLEEWRKVRRSVAPEGVFVSDMSRRLELWGRSVLCGAGAERTSYVLPRRPPES